MTAKNWLRRVIPVSLFLILITISLVFNSIKIKSLDPENRKELFLEEKISNIYTNLANQNPTIRRITNKNDLSRLSFYNKIGYGDLIFIYPNKNIAVFVGIKSENILGVTAIK